MKTLWMSVFAFLIAVSAAVMDLRGSISFENDQITSGPEFQSALQTDSLHSPAERFSKNSHVIAQEFFPIVIIAEAYDISPHFSFYLPLYNLNRQKEYFLLI